MVQNSVVVGFEKTNVLDDVVIGVLVDPDGAADASLFVTRSSGCIRDASLSKHVIVRSPCKLDAIVSASEKIRAFNNRVCYALKFDADLSILDVPPAIDDHK